MQPDKMIAIVDDYKLFRHGFAGLVNSIKGFSVLFTAETGTDFIRQLNPAALPAIVLLDTAMPEMDGYETLVWIKKYYPAIKVLSLHMEATREELEKMRVNGADGYLLKTADPTEIAETFRKVLRKD